MLLMMMVRTVLSQLATMRKNKDTREMPQNSTDATVSTACISQ